MSNICAWFLLFIIYSIIGFTAETIFCSVPVGHFVERGFLNGPLCPIYGFGALLVLSVLSPFAGDATLVFLFGMVLTTLLEYATSYLLEKCFKMHWWDYSDQKFNINGRVCLLNSLLFGLLCLALTEWIHPFISGIVFKIPLLPLYILSGCVFALLMLDTTLSVVSVLKLSGRLEKLHILQQQLSEKLKETVEEGEKRSLEFMEELEGLKEKILSTQLNTKYYEARILRAFPQLESYKDRDLANELRKKLNEQKQKFKELKDSLNKK